MYPVVIVCLLVAAVSAGPSPLHLMRGTPVQVPPKTKLGKLQDAPEKCCGDAYYTFKISGAETSAVEGKLKSEYVSMEGAYDSISKAIGLQGERTLSDGTSFKFKMIADYKKGEGYSLKMEGGVLNCTKFPIDTPFPYACVPEDSTFVGQTRVGDHALAVDNWYINHNISSKAEAHAVVSIAPTECVEVGRVSRVFSKTGVELRLMFHSLFDFNLGICDRDVWFKPPEECQSSTVQAVKDIPIELTELPGPFGKKLF